MSIKEIALKTIRELPENVEWDDILDRMLFVSGIEKGLRELDDGQGIPFNKVKEELKEWISG